MQYGLTLENEALIIEKAKSKKDGVYTFRGVYYRVNNHYVTHYAWKYEILEKYGYFNVVCGTYDVDPAKILKQIK